MAAARGRQGQGRNKQARRVTTSSGEFRRWQAFASEGFSTVEIVEQVVLKSAAFAARTIRGRGGLAGRYECARASEDAFRKADGKAGRGR